MSFFLRYVSFAQEVEYNHHLQHATFLLSPSPSRWSQVETGEISHFLFYHIFFFLVASLFFLPLPVRVLEGTL